MINIPKNKITFIEATDRSEESWARALSEIYGFNISNPLDYINKKYLKKIKSPNEKTRLKAHQIKRSTKQYFVHADTFRFHSKPFT